MRARGIDDAARYKRRKNLTHRDETLGRTQRGALLARTRRSRNQSGQRRTNHTRPERTNCARNDEGRD